MLDDSRNYTLSTTPNEKTRTITVNDPSYLYFEFDDSTITSPKNTLLTISSDKKTATLYMKDTSTTYTNFVGVLYALGQDHTDNKLQFQAKSFLDGTMTSETSKVTGVDQRLNTDYGIWRIDDEFPNTVKASSNESYFMPDSTAINSIPPGKEAKVELHFDVETDITDVTTLHFVHNTSATWDDNAKTSLVKLKTDDFSMPSEATITTYHGTLTDLAFKSKLDNGTPTALTLG